MPETTSSEQNPVGALKELMLYGEKKEKEQVKNMT